MKARSSGNFDLSVENLLHTAEVKTRLSDWGDEDIRLPLGQLVGSFEKEYGQDQEKKFSFSYMLTDLLTKRLYIQDNFKSFPGIQDIRIERPLFVTGLPRTGTTLMHNLLSQDPCWRVFPYWELIYPYYNANMGKDFEPYAMRMAEQLLQGLYARYPNLISRHETRVDGPEECVHLLRYTFYSNSFAVEWELSDYLHWYIDQDLTDSYRYYRKILQLLQWRKPKSHILSKCPTHLLGVKAISNVFPDGRVVWMHREPCKCIASVISLFSVFRATPTRFNSFIDLYLDYFKKSVDMAMDTVQKGTDRIMSVSYKQLVKNPVQAVREIYENFAYPIDPGHEQGIARWLAENPQHKHGVHQYSLGDFGITEADIRRRFARYYDEYGHLI